jgi:hypothetical protein
MAAVTDYLRAVMDIVAPLQIDRGGPVILLQVENPAASGADGKADAAASPSSGTVAPVSRNRSVSACR